jgi:predicted metal-binding membrane protein
VSALRAVAAELRQYPSAVAVLGSAATGWIALIALVASPWSAYFSHDALEDIGGHLWETATLAIGWTTMVVAMMLPTTVPLVALFDRLTIGRQDRRRLLACLVAGYMLVWLAAGAAMHVGDLGIHWLVKHWEWLTDNEWAIEATTLAIAGAYQFTGLKSRCLMRCRSPESFIRRHWQGSRESVRSLTIGIHNGAFCVGCCWSLMLVMFSVGVANIAWMAALTLVMVAEKTFRLGPRITTPVGISLVGAAVITMLAR